MNSQNQSDPNRHLETKSLLQRVAELEAAQASLAKELELSRSANRFLSSILDTLDALVVVVDTKGRIVRMNRTFQEVVAAGGERVQNKYLWDLMLLPDDIKSIQASIRQLVKHQAAAAAANCWLSRQGALRLTAWSFTRLPGAGGQVEHIVGVGLDITEQEQAEESLRVSKERFQTLFNGVNDAVYVYNLPQDGQPGRLIEVNEIACWRLGYCREELLAMTVEDIEQSAQAPQDSLIAHQLRTHNRVLFEARHIPKTGAPFPVEVNAHLFSLYGQPTVLAVARDITERKQLEKQLRYMTEHDSLTGLYNRAYFDEEMARLSRLPPVRTGVIVCDVDGLKLVNDAMGHQAGDLLLKAVADAIALALPLEAFVARIGGDEFVAILHQTDQTAVELTCQRIHQAVIDYNRSVQGLPLSLSIGYAVGTDSDIHSLIKTADDRMYDDKRARSQAVRKTFTLVLAPRREEADNP